MQRIASEIGNCDAALVFIGDKWLEPTPAGGRPRIFEPNDYVRAELGAALSRPLLIVPVLVGGARMPKQEQLPQDIRAITTKNALPLRHESFDDDTENIVAAVLGLSPGERAWEDKGTLKAKIGYAIGGATRRLCSGADWRAAAFLDLGASAFRLDRRATHHACADRRRDRGRLDGPALRGTETEIAVRRTRVSPRWARTRSARARRPSAQTRRDCAARAPTAAAGKNPTAAGLHRDCGKDRRGARRDSRPGR